MHVIELVGAELQDFSRLQATMIEEIGYTALARHQDDARFEVSASPDFLIRRPTR